MPAPRSVISLGFACITLVMPASAESISASAPLAPKTADGFSVPQQGHTFVFPRDHGAHLGFRLEWWYITGHLFTREGGRYGFQATFFRRGNRVGDDDGDAFLGSSQFYLAHMSLLDVAKGRFIFEERLNRDGWDAGTAPEKLDAHNGNWSLRMTDVYSETMHLVGSIRADALFDLTLYPSKPHIVFGEDGVSRKGADPTAASYYITFPRLEANGSLRLGGDPFAVSGTAWMDHEISSSQLSSGQVGWDWCGLQLDDGWEIMAYRLRRADGSSDPYSTLTWIAPNGVATRLGRDAFSWTPIETWKSPATGGEYPVRYRLRALSPKTGHMTTLEVRALAPNQELSGELGGIAYWEGAGDVLSPDGQPIGRGYSEFTGYAESLDGKF